MQYEFENRVVTKVLEKLIIAATNPLICYLIIEIDYVNPFLISKLIVLSIKFKVFGETSFANNSLAKHKR